MNQIKTKLLDIINETTTKVNSAKGTELYDLIDLHPDFPHCEVFLVDLVNTLKKELKHEKINITKNQIISIYKKHEGKENANELRVENILSI